MIIKIIQGDITTATADAIVNPANSYGTMSGGVALAIKRAGGASIEQAAKAHGLCPVGQAYSTPAGQLSVRAIIHAPTMTHPAEPIPAKQVELATTAALRLADDSGFETVALPGMGTGAGDVAVDEAARIMIETIAMYMVDQRLREVQLYALTDELYQAFLKHYDAQS
ncbi:MAG: macro domain-containing protein [Candidatus Kerfeldbacteria bacterium]|nr:macro domain-containing protein [Candidatus Kerfeldbacteria bacterium]